MDSTDAKILRALQISPRVAFAEIAALIGLSEQTVSRRYSRMKQEGIVRVRGVPDPWSAGQHVWISRVRCQPRSARSIALALAERADISWVAIDASSSEVTCAVRSTSRFDREDLLLQRLPQSSPVTSLETSVVFEQFAGGRLHHQAHVHGVLDADQEEQLRKSRPPLARPVVRSDEASVARPLDARDRAIIATLAEDGRASIAALATATALTHGRTTRRLERLFAEQLVNVDVDILSASLGYEVRANLWLDVAPSRLREVGAALAAIPQVSYAAAITGEHNLYSTVLCRDYAELYSILTGPVSLHDGVRSITSSLVGVLVKQARSRISQGRFV